MDQYLARANVASIAALVLLLSAIALVPAESAEDSARFSSEAKFADTSVQGLSIVPASCNSYPHYVYECSCPTAIESGNDGYGRILYANYTHRMINAHGVFQCVSNLTGNTFFVPHGDYYQVQSFINAAPSLGVPVYAPF
jgi:hypothetical protein